MNYCSVCCFNAVPAAGGTCGSCQARRNNALQAAGDADPSPQVAADLGLPWPPTPVTANDTAEHAPLVHPGLGTEPTAFYNPAVNGLGWRTDAPYPASLEVGVPRSPEKVLAVVDEAESVDPTTFINGGWWAHAIVPMGAIRGTWAATGWNTQNLNKRGTGWKLDENFQCVPDGPLEDRIRTAIGNALFAWRQSSTEHIPPAPRLVDDLTRAVLDVVGRPAGVMSVPGKNERTPPNRRAEMYAVLVDKLVGPSGTRVQSAFQDCLGSGPHGPPTPEHRYRVGNWVHYNDATVIGAGRFKPVEGLVLSVDGEWLNVLTPGGWTNRLHYMDVLGLESAPAVTEKPKHPVEPETADHRPYLRELTREECEYLQDRSQSHPTVKSNGEVTDCMEHYCSTVAWLQDHPRHATTYLKWMAEDWSRMTDEQRQLCRQAVWKPQYWELGEEWGAVSYPTLRQLLEAPRDKSDRPPDPSPGRCLTDSWYTPPPEADTPVIAE